MTSVSVGFCDFERVFCKNWFFLTNFFLVMNEFWKKKYYKVLRNSLIKFKKKFGCDPRRSIQNLQINVRF
jgi:hypothetical protein